MKVMDKSEVLRRLSANVKRKMESAKIGVNELARRAGVDPMTVSRLINKKRMPKAYSVFMIANALEVSIDSLFANVRKSRKSN